MSETLSLRDVLDDAALLSLEHQIHLSEIVGEHSWQVDLNAAAFSFTGDVPRTCTAMHLLGSAAPGPRSWLWAWANPSGYPHAVVERSMAVREFGERHGIAVLASPEVGFGELPGGPDDPITVSAMLTDAAKVATGRWTSYNGPGGGGTRAAFLVEHPDFVLPEPDPARVMRVIQQGLAEIELGSHRRAITCYATRRGLAVTTGADGALSISDARLEASVRFRPGGRLDGISAKLRGTEAAQN